jgi:hypothetical protein
LGYSVSDGGNVFTFPAKELPGNTYMLLLLDDLLTPGESTCFTTNPCYKETWGVSASGETITLKNPGGSVVDTTHYPGEPTLQPNATWGRMPNGSGEFAACKRTPEAENQSP